ncbi:hypothetical protein PGQ11_009104 [Apiospora arundinis]|uniref:Uncharacterized protein n=1 Tax=Apiospora arundinis TaxID=335852 RepID=A0ABR2IHU8_9PEZI
MFSNPYRAVPPSEDDPEHPRGSPHKVLRILLWALPFVILQGIEITLLFSLAKRSGCPTDTTQKPGSYQSLLEFSHSADFEMIFRKEDLDSRVRNFTYWRSLFPTAQGLVSIPNNSPLAPPDIITAPSALDRTHSVYQVSLFHSLHCLEALKFVLDSTAPDHGITEDLARTHAPHCIDWIRQEIMCSADITLDSILDEYKTPHQCRDFDRIWQWTEAHGYGGPLKEILHHKLHDHGEVVSP